MDEPGELQLPCFLHWNSNHFVVPAKSGKSKVTILDPAAGERKLTCKEVSGHFTPRFKAWGLLGETCPLTCGPDSLRLVR